MMNSFGFYIYISSIRVLFEEMNKLSDCYSDKVKQHLENTKTKYLLVFVLHKKFDA